MKVSARDDATIREYDQFGRSVANVGDIDADLVTDIGVGAPFDDDGGRDRGAVWIVTLKRDGTAKSYQKISSIRGGLEGQLRDGDLFGWSIALLGDIDADTLSDIAVGAPGDPGPPTGKARGAVWILSLRRDGTVSGEKKLNSEVGTFGSTLVNGIMFGASVAGLGDLDGDGIPDLVVGAPGDNDGGRRRGAVWMMLLNSGGAPHRQYKISQNFGQFDGQLHDGDEFGYAVANIGDLNGDGFIDLAVGAPYDDDGGDNRGAVWIVFLDVRSLVLKTQKLSTLVGGATIQLSDNLHFGSSLASYPDMNGDGVQELIVGAPLEDTSGLDRGAFFLLRMKPDGTTTYSEKRTADNWPSTPIQPGGMLGSSIAVLGNLDQQNGVDIVVGVPLYQASLDTVLQPGAAIVTLITGAFAINTHVPLSHYGTNLLETVSSRYIGWSATGLGDVDGDGVADLGIGDAYYNSQNGRLMIHFLRSDGTVKSTTSITKNTNGLPNTYTTAFFGRSLDSAGDINGDGIPDVVVGAPRTVVTTGDEGGVVWLVFLNRDGSVQAAEHYKAGTPNFVSSLPTNSRLGRAVAFMGDNDGDGLLEIATSAPNYPYLQNQGSLFILHVTQRGSLQRFTQIYGSTGNFIPFADNAGFGSNMAAIGDVDGDGIGDLAVSTLYTQDPVGGTWLLFLKKDATVKSYRHINGAGSGGLDVGSRFTVAIPAAAGDVDGDGTPDLILGFPDWTDDRVGGTTGAFALGLLDPDGSIREYIQFDAAHEMLSGSMHAGQAWGVSVGLLSDIDGDGVQEIVIGDSADNEAGTSHGAVWVFSLKKLLATAPPDSRSLSNFFYECRVAQPAELHVASWMLDE